MLTHHKGRLLLAIAGIAFAVLMMFMQLGFLTGLFDGQTRVIHLMNADLILINKIRHNINTKDVFPKERLRQALDVEGVASAWPVQWDISLWKNRRDGHEHLIRVIAFDPSHPVFLIPEIERSAGQLDTPETVLFDRLSRDFYGQPQVGTVGELARRRTRVVGLFDLGADFKHDGTVITSEQSFFQYFPRSNRGKADLGLLRLQPGADRGRVLAELRRRLPGDVMVLPREEYARVERTFWAKMTPTGFIFGLGLVVGFIIGVMICYQILYNDVTDHLPQFATLKAIGYPDQFLVRLVLREALLLALLGLVPALLASQAFYALMWQLCGVRMRLTVGRVTLVAVLTLVMCMVCGPDCRG